ncbi:MAG: alpha-ketoglutarate-dependent dioxygenase AlkB [Pseudomonadota bacterium]|nr:alpha-ketoglutarate-dependent dioxygenase AlkB [Pseudomonadota bacterium]
MYLDNPLVGIDYRPGWMAADQAAALFECLLRGVAWQVHRIQMFGRWLDAPRLSCWMGDADAHYRYSGSDFIPQPWQADVARLRDCLNRALAADFNSVLLNQYRDGCDSMGWHRDDEPELGPAPLIASLSLGATRRFVLKEGDGRRPLGRDNPRHVFNLAAGDLLLMHGDSQCRYRHALPKTAKPVGARINLTFRRIIVGCGG